jgi:hypothetical protein
MPVKRVPLIAALLIACLLPATGSAAAATQTLSVGKAKTLAAKKADKVRRQLSSEGARRAAVPGCWRNSARQVSCFFSVYGFDPEQKYSWKCMLRIVVRLRHHPDKTGRRYSYKYGHAICG